MSLITRMLRKKCVYWPPVGVDSFGKPVVGPPIELRCRWEDTIEEVLSADGEKKLTSARVYLSQDVVPRGYLLNDELANIKDQLNPFNNLDDGGNPLAHRIIKFNATPKLNYRETVRIAYLT